MNLPSPSLSLWPNSLILVTTVLASNHYQKWINLDSDLISGLSISCTFGTNTNNSSGGKEPGTEDTSKGILKVTEGECGYKNDSQRNAGHIGGSDDKGRVVQTLYVWKRQRLGLLLELKP